MNHYKYTKILTKTLYINYIINLISRLTVTSNGNNTFDCLRTFENKTVDTCGCKMQRNLSNFVVLLIDLLFTICS